MRLVDENGKQLGIVPVEHALERATTKGLDLVEVAPDADPPVCRIMDYTKFVYEQKRKQKLARKKTHRLEIKEIKFRPNIDPHDLSIKTQHMREFLEKGHKVKVTMRYRPREMRHYEIGSQVIDKLVEALKGIAIVESSARGKSSMRTQSLLLAPKKAIIKPEGENVEKETASIERGA